MLLILVSCGGGSTVAEETTLPVTESPETQAPEITLQNSDGTGYVIVVPSGSSPVRDAAFDMKAQSYAVTGKQLFVQSDSGFDATPLEILIGATNRPESSAAAQGLERGEYRAVWINGKLVLAGGSVTAAAECARVVYDRYFKDASGSITVPSELLIEGSVELMNLDNLKTGWNPLLFSSSCGVELKYQLLIPENYDATRSYPVILYMHSAGVRCNDNSHIYTGEAKFLRNLETGDYRDDCIVIAPCCPESDKWVPVSTWKGITYNFAGSEPTRYMRASWELFEELLLILPADMSRLYTYGMSMGAFAVWDLLLRHPGVFAAAVPVAGAGDPTVANTVSDTAVWIFHGTLDTTVPVESAHRMRDALLARGLDVKYTEFPNAGHGIWVATADTVGLYDWLFAQSLSD